MGIPRIKHNQASEAATRDADLLTSEIQFWREMIESLVDGDHSREATERMRQALALAEYRLACLGDGRLATPGSGAKSPIPH